MYLNYISYGGTAVGIEAAANKYFNKSSKDLSLAEASLLAGLPQAPTIYSPFAPSGQKMIYGFFVFLAFQKRFRDARIDDMMKDSYKLSLLFWIYVIINLLLISLWYRSKLLGIWLFIGFVFLQVFLFMGFEDKNDDPF